jgi:predicted ATPase
VNLARRLEEFAAPGAVLASQTVYDQTKRLFDFETLPGLALKGIADAVTAYRVLRPKEKPGIVRGLEGLHAPMVGRETELSRLLGVLERLEQERQGALVLLTGEGGMGKSRLTAELKERARAMRVQVLEGQSLTYRKSIAYWLFQDTLRKLAGVTAETAGDETRTALTRTANTLLGETEAADVLPYLDALMGLEPNSEAEERIRYLDPGQLRGRISLAVRDLLVAAAHVKPLLLILEDLHWADDASLDLLLFLLDSVRSEPLLLLAISRPYEGLAVAQIAERANQRLGSRYLAVRLHALQPDQTKQLLNELLALPDLPEAFREQIITRAAGMPFYLEEILRMLIQDEVLRRAGDGWELTPGADLGRARVPDSLQGLILARFDRLEPAPRRVLQAASVLGDRFKSPVLFEMLADQSQVRPALSLLTEREFLVSDILDETQFGFRHTLVADAVYATLLQQDRKELHTQAGLAIERLATGRLEAQVEILAMHFLRSSLQERALRYLIMAGQKTAAAYIAAQSRTFFSQALETLPFVEHSLEQALAVHSGLGDALLTLGEYPVALAQFAAALETVDRIGPTEYAHWAALQRKAAAALERQGSYDEALARLDTAEALLEAHPGADQAEQARILNDHGWIYFRRGDLDRAEPLLERALSLAESAGQVDVVASVYNRLGGIFFQRGQTGPAEEFVRKSLALRERIGDLVAVARIYNNLGLLDWKLGQWSAALENFNRAYKLQSELGDVEALIELEGNLGLLQIVRADFASAEIHLQAALDRARQIGHSYQMGQAHLHLTLLAVTKGEWRRALETGVQANELFTNIGVKENLLGLHAILGLAWLNLGELERAEESARTAAAAYEELGGESSGRVDDYARLVYLLGELAGARGQLEQAAGHYQCSAALFAQAGDRLQRGRSLLRAAENALTRGARAESLASLREAELELENSPVPQDHEAVAALTARLK